MITESDLVPGAYKSIAQALREQFDGADDWRGRVCVAVDTSDGGTAYVEVHAAAMLWWEGAYMPDGNAIQLRSVMFLRWETHLAGSNAEFELNADKVKEELLKL